MRYLLLTPLLFLIFTSTVAVSEPSETFSNPNEALHFLGEQLHDPDGLKDENVRKMEDAVAVLYMLTEHSKLSDNSQAWVLSFRARGVQALNAKNKREGNPIAHHKVTLALQDFYKMKAFPDHSAFGNAMFSAGHLAAHLLEDWQLATDFWNLCADQNHAGCMNILASNYFNNTTSQPVDIAKSIYWHKQVYRTGTQYRCAGIYSAARVANLLFHFPKQSPEDNWQDWTENTLGLLKQLKQEHPEVQCSDEGWMQITFFTMYANSGVKVPERLSESIANHQETEVKSIFRHLQRGNLQQATELVINLSDSEARCEAAKDLLLIAITEENESVFKQLDDIIANDTSVGCHFVASRRQQLQQIGRWSTMM